MCHLLTHSHFFWHALCCSSGKFKNTIMAEKDINIEELLKKSEEEAQNKECAGNCNCDNTAEADVTDKAENTDEEAEATDPLAELQAQVEQLKNDLLYKQAEFDNFRKRTIKEKAELILNGAEKTVKDILPIVDDFERALADKTDDPAAIREGMNLIFNKFMTTMEKMGVKKIETKDADFNVDYHEAIAMVPGMGDDKKGKVIDCVQTGYTLNDKVIRHAKVAVGQ